MLTEDEARKRWCPFANVYEPFQHTGAAGNRGLDQGDGSKAKCIASECMAFRWQALDASDPRFMAAMRKAMDEGVPHTKAATVIVTERAKYGLPEKPDHGYCGLAGQP